MFGESESESPRVPSPWDSLIFTPPSPASSRAQTTPSPLATELIPKLVPEADDGNVEYKLQLLSPSPARFARLVTQLKWRLLEGGGQAYYELGVADSGALVGLPKAELELSLETLEMMAGEIGASVIVVKEIEVPAAMAGLAGSQTDHRNGRRKYRRDTLADSEESYSTATTASETEIELSATDEDGDEEDLSATVVFEKNAPNDATPLSSPLFSMDSDPDPADNADGETELESEGPLSSASSTLFSLDLEISSVYKPRPPRPRAHNHLHMSMGPAKSKHGPRMKKHKHPLVTAVPSLNDESNHHHSHLSYEEAVPGVQHNKQFGRRQSRDKRREERRKALLVHAAGALPATNEPDTEQGTIIAESETPPDNHNSIPPLNTDSLLSDLQTLHVSLGETTAISKATSTKPSSADYPVSPPEDGENDDGGDDDVFASSTPMKPFHMFSSSSSSGNSEQVSTTGATEGLTRLIVEALVVRKMSLDEAFIDFSRFSVMLS